MRYRQDVPPGADVKAVILHVTEHLAGAVSPDDDPTSTRHRVQVTVAPHEDLHTDLLSVVGEIDGDPVAAYLHPDFDPAADHPEIRFTPYEEPERGHFADRAALALFREGQ